MEPCSLETSLERSFQSISIDDAGSSTDSSPVNQPLPASRLNPHDLPPPFHWDQYLYLKTGEVYYVDWQSGRKVKKETGQAYLQIKGEEEGEGHCNSQDDYEEEENVHTDVGEKSPTESDAASCSTPEGYLKLFGLEHDDILVVAGCRRCLTYFMLPKIADECPKCKNSLLHLNGF